MKRIFFILLVFAALSISAQNNTFVELNNDKLLLKFDLSRGGVIAYISKANDSRNIVNTFDEGRYVQQSYYAGKSLDRKAEGQSPAWSPWPWNPIQVGDYYFNRAKILANKKYNDTMYVKCIPMLWDMNNKPAEATIEQWTTIKDNVIWTRNRLTCHRTDTIYGEGRACDQELPAVYPISALKNLYTYFGKKPFKGKALTNTKVVLLSSGFWGRYLNDTVSEKWMAFVNDSLWGLGVYCPIADNFIAGMAGKPGFETKDESTSYIAPIKKVVLNKNSVYEYEYYLIVGTLNEIRSKVYSINKKSKTKFK